MTTDPIEVIQQFAHGMKIVGYDVSKVYAALETVRSNYLPLELLRDGCYVALMGKDVIHHEHYWFCRINHPDGRNWYAQGTTPNAAFLAAVKQIGDV